MAEQPDETGLNEFLDFVLSANGNEALGNEVLAQVA